ncbi:MAG TPA: DUF4011 domain-containing protein [Ktedonobacterales bacterium]|nr:DUF4011 domain-containing protein [Ktedonobacterales bacterium]
MAVDEKLNSWRNDLLDMSRRNSLLYFSSTGRTSSVQFRVDADELFRKLVYGKNPSVLTPEATTLEPDDFPKRLERLRTKAREALNDRGMQVLYVAFGLLEWKETPTSDDTIRSPLVLVPVGLDKKRYFGSFQLALLGDEEITINPTLTARLDASFSITLPTFETIEVAVAAESEGVRPRQLTLADIFRRIQRALPPDSPWTIAREAHLGAFSFQKLVMYQDLGKHAAEAKAHPILRALGGEAAVLPRAGNPALAGEMDERVRPQDMLEILDADSSQQEAIQAAKAGRSFVLQGPPGTGKSQTIANIIAESLGQNRRVLFVSEKMAALDVVRQRLRAAGLGEFLLDLHNARTDKKAFFADLKQQVEAVTDLRVPQDNEGRWNRDSSALASARQQLNEYVRELHAPRGPLGKSAFEAHATLAHLAATPDIDAAIADVAGMSAVEMDERRRALKSLLTRVDVLDELETYPWRQTLARTPSLELEGSIRSHFDLLVRGLADLEAGLRRLRESLGEEDVALTFGWADLAVRRAEHARRTPLPPEHWMLPGAPARLRNVLALATAQAARYGDALRRFEPVCLPSARALETTTLLAALTDEAAGAVACLRASRDVPEDAAIIHRAELDTGLTQAQSLLPRIGETVGALAEICGLSAPNTVEAATALAEIAACLLNTPQPPASWLDADAFAGVRALALDASTRYAEARRVRATLEARYTPAFFALDVPGLAQRFTITYAGVLHVFMPAYYADLKQVRATLQPGQTRNAVGICADVAAARGLLEEERSLRDASIEHARVFGRFFGGEATDWLALRAAVDWTTRFHTLVSREDMTREMTRLATAPSSGRSALRDVSSSLAEVLDEWRDVGEALGALLKPGPLAEGARTLETAPMGALLAGLTRVHGSLRTYWQAVDTVAPHLRHAASDTESVGASGGRLPASEAALTWEALRACVRLAAELNTLDGWLAGQESALRHDLGARYAGWETRWVEAEEAVTWVEVLLDTYPRREMPTVLRQTLAEGGDVEARERLHAALDRTRNALAAVEEELRYSDTVLPRYALLDAENTQQQTAVAALRERVAFHLENLPCLERWLECVGHRARCEALGLGEVIRAARRRRPFPRDLVDVFEKRFYQLWLDAVRRECPALARFSGDTHEQTIAHFRELDANHQQLAQRRLAARLHQARVDAVHVPQQHADDDLTRGFEAVRREVNKKRHRSIRHVVATTAPAMLMLKPCWLMSPLSVSQYVESPDALFDVVVFDEASQVCPEDAICAILRGKQLIVVGDSKQLPPTRFFTKTLADAADDTEDDDDAKEDERTSSILEECQAVSFPESSLLWHYRSQHESLIAFSNAHFYDGRLQTFPGPQAHHQDGVRFVYVEDGRYDKGRTRQNRREAERVVDLIVEHVRERPKLSLGVVALSEAQQRAISEALEKRRKQDEELAAYDDLLNEDTPGGFFIKNLESVQGDERDVILLSVGYGKHDESGRVERNFGPVNREGGERRLNVAVTRAKHRLILVASLHASDLHGELKNLGARTLRDYLEYAERGPSVLEQQQRDAEARGDGALQFESPFEEAVYTALTAKGLSLATQVGCSGYRIDLAAKDPRDGGRFLLGIECDGAMYHSSRTARDRDRLRQQHLERMGWRIHRIWSRDWIRNPAAEVAKALRAVEEAQAALTSKRQVEDPPDTPATDAAPIEPSAPLQASGPMTAPKTAASIPAAVSSMAHVTIPAHETSKNGSAQRAAARTCEACAFYQEQTAMRFYCGRDATTKARRTNGRTPACPAWKAMPSRQ